jgi:glycine cleavage system H protein
VNERLADEPGLVKAEPNGDGWMFKMRNVNAADIDGLLDENAYKALIAASDAGH